jgi:hypothetical protein
MAKAGRSIPLVSHTSPRRRLAIIFIAAALGVLIGACNSSSPTEPQSRTARLSVRGTPGPAGSGGEMTVRAAVCDCSPGALEVELDGGLAGTMGCAEAKVFSISAGQHRVIFRSSWLSVPATLEFVEDPAFGVIIDVACLTQ